MNILLSAPYWVYILFFFFLIKGIKGLKSQIISIKSLCILPLIFVSFSIYSVFFRFPMTAFNISLWIILFSAGAFLGKKLAPSSVEIDKRKGLIKLPGSPFPLFIFLTIFSVKFGMGYLNATQPDWINKDVLLYIDICLFGLIPGFFLGRTVSLVQKAKEVSMEKAQ